tara:strand:- start:14051 stop:14638 length:588 start_codon:yes stop_codon:yes gene_type:complete
VNTADLARSILLTIPKADIDRSPDPGEPADDDRETIILKSGKTSGRELRRKPRLQLRMPEAIKPEHLRKALNLALLLACNDVEMTLSLPGDPPPPPPGPTATETELKRLCAQQREQIDRLQSIAGVLVNDAPPGGVQSARDALHILGFVPGASPAKAEIRARFRMLATIHHPDSEFGSHERMSLLNQAAEHLLKR